MAGTVLHVAFRVIGIENNLSKVCYIDRSRRVRESDSQVGNPYGQFSGKNKFFFVVGSGAALGATRAETNATTMIFGLVTLEKMSNRSFKVVLSALHAGFEVGRLQQSKTARKASPVPENTKTLKIAKSSKILDNFEIFTFRKSCPEDVPGSSAVQRHSPGGPPTLCRNDLL